MGSYGYNGKILKVDLSARIITEEQPPEVLYRRYLGGGALSLYYLLKELRPGIDPYGSDNLLIFSASVVTGTRGLGFSRFTVASKSPLTHGFGESEAGGWWGPELKFSGFDAILVKGRAGDPVYLWVHDGKAELRDASHLWGQCAKEAQGMIRQELGDEKARVALIGPGGEKLVRFACILNELRHANGRSGLGAVMGAKNLKAIAVRGKKKIEVYDPERTQGIVQELLKIHKENPGALGTLGTARVVSPLNAGGMLPTRNFISGTFERAEDISGETMKDTILVARGTCFGCPIRCKREVRVEEPFTVDPVYGGPEYETVAALGSLCGIGDLKAIALANQLCGAYTLDTISTGTTIAFAMECFEKGIISTADTGGIKLEFGNSDAMLQMIELIGKREGFGDLLAEGVSRAAEQLGQEAHKYAMHVKGQPLPLHEPRGKSGLALAYALSPTGADHLEAPHDPMFESEAGLRTIKPLGILEPLPALDLTSRKVRIFMYLQHLYNMYNSIGMCVLAADPYPSAPLSIKNLVNYVNAVTGWNTSLWELLKVGERHSNMARLFNLREGITSTQDSIPSRFFQAMQEGPLKGSAINPQEFEQAIMRYYQMMGWNERGIPGRGKLQELELEWVEDSMPSQILASA
jgi:aldehyde:ferredoxin oxidoreductase